MRNSCSNRSRAWFRAAAGAPAAPTRMAGAVCGGEIVQQSAVIARIVLVLKDADRDSLRRTVRPATSGMTILTSALLQIAQRRRIQIQSLQFDDAGMALEIGDERVIWRISRIRTVPGRGSEPSGARVLTSQVQLGHL